MTTSRFGALASSAAQSSASVRHLSLGARFADRLNLLCQHPLDRLIKAFADGARVHYINDLPVLCSHAWKDATGGRHWRLGRVELEVFKKRTPGARVAAALDEAESRWGWGEAWEEMVALGIKDKVGAPARQLIYQGRWRDLDAWVVQRRAETAKQRRGA